MPLYEYECDACGRRFELIRKFSDPEVETCTLCGSGPIRRLQSSPAIQFKGSGWYVTDYAGKGRPDTPAAGKSAEGKEGKSEAGSADSTSKTGTDAAPATKSEPAAKPPASSSSTGEPKS